MKKWSILKYSKADGNAHICFNLNARDVCMMWTFNTNTCECRIKIDKTFFGFSVFFDLLVQSEWYFPSFTKCSWKLKTLKLCIYWLVSQDPHSLNASTHAANFYISRATATFQMKHHLLFDTLFQTHVYSNVPIQIMLHVSQLRWFLQTQIQIVIAVSQFLIYLYKFLCNCRDFQFFKSFKEMIWMDLIFEKTF